MWPFDCFGYKKLQDDYDFLYHENQANIEHIRMIQHNLSLHSISQYLQTYGSIFPHGKAEEEKSLLQKFSQWVQR